MQKVKIKKRSNQEFVTLTWEIYTSNVIEFGPFFFSVELLRLDRIQILVIRETNSNKTANKQKKTCMNTGLGMPEHNMDVVSKEWLQSELRSPTKSLIVLDCRSYNEFQEGHIRSAVNFSIPSLILKRLATGKIDLTSTIKCRDLKQRIQNAYTDSLFILYNDVSIFFHWFFFFYLSWLFLYLVFC